MLWSLATAWNVFQPHVFWRMKRFAALRGVLPNLRLPTGSDTLPPRYLCVPLLLFPEPERRSRVFVHVVPGWHFLQKATLNCRRVGSNTVACATCFMSFRLS